MITGRLVRNFSLQEMQDCGTLVITPEVVQFAQMLQELRNWYSKPININSWYRTQATNYRVGGSSNSLHLNGLAVDISIKGDLQNKFCARWQEICKKYGIVGGFNYYNTYIHISYGEDKFGYSSFKIRDYRKE